MCSKWRPRLSFSLIFHSEVPEYGLCNCLIRNVLLPSVLYSVLQLSPRENEVFYDVVAIVDPLTRAAQKMSALLIVSCVLVPLHSVTKRRVQKYKEVYDKT